MFIQNRQSLVAQLVVSLTDKEGVVLSSVSHG